MTAADAAAFTLGHQVFIERGAGLLEYLAKVPLPLLDNNSLICEDLHVQYRNLGVD